MKEIFTMDLKGKLLIAVVFMVLGFMLSVQYKTTELQRNVRMDRVEDLSERLKIMEAENKQLLTELETLRAGAAKDPADDRMKLMAGTTDVEGEGIEILLDDSNIMAFIRKLRKKIEPDPDAPRYILTLLSLIHI